MVPYHSTTIPYPYRKPLQPPPQPTHTMNTLPSAASDGDLSNASSVLYLHDCSAWTVRIAPARRPAVWFFINLFGAVASMAVLMDCLLSRHHERAMMFAQEVYLVYDVTLTAVWCLEISLTVLERCVSQKTLRSWPLWMEVCLAFVFWWTSIQLLMAWRIQDMDILSNVGDTLLNLAAYLYVAYECWGHHRQQRRECREHGLDPVEQESNNHDAYYTLADAQAKAAKSP